jgi:hypothetical protein
MEFKILSKEEVGAKSSVSKSRLNGDILSDIVKAIEASQVGRGFEISREQLAELRGKEYRNTDGSLRPLKHYNGSFRQTLESACKSQVSIRNVSDDIILIVKKADSKEG